MASYPVRLNGFGAWYDDVLGFARNIIPSGTVVGNAIGSTRPKGGSAAQAAVESMAQPYPYAPGQGPGPQMTVNAGTPSWVLPVAIGGGVLLLAMLFMPKRR